MSAFQHRQGRHVADGTVQADGVVFEHVFRDTAFRILEAERRQEADAVAFDGAMGAFDLSLLCG